MSRKIFLFVLLLFLLPLGAEGASIEFAVSDLTSSADLAELLGGTSHFVPLEPEKHKAVGKGFRISEMPLLLLSGDEYRLLLICEAIGESGWLRNIQLVVIDERTSPANVIQRIKLGDGEAPQMLRPDKAPAARDFMVRVIRRGNFSEAWVYAANDVTGRLEEALHIDRALPDRMKLDIKGTMMANGYVSVASKTPNKELIVDLSEALDALIEDGLYQPGGRPISALVNLTCVRGGWENERIYRDGGELRLDIGLSLVALSKKQVVDVTLTLSKDEKNTWKPREIKCEPFLPYSW